MSRPDKYSVQDLAREIKAGTVSLNDLTNHGMNLLADTVLSTVGAIEGIVTKMHGLCTEIDKFPDFDDLGIEQVKVRSALLRDIEEKARDVFNALLAEWKARKTAAPSATRASEFVVAGFFKQDMGRWIEVSDRQCEEEGVEFLYMVAKSGSPDGGNHG